MVTSDAESAARALRRIGPYTPITRLDDRASRFPVPEHRYIARSPDGDRTVLVSVPLPGTDLQRYMTEADASRYLLGPWASPATELAAPGDAPWHARPYLPALPLPTVLAVHGGPLPSGAHRPRPRRRPRRDARRRARAEPHARRCLPGRCTARRRRAPPHLLRRGALRGAGRDLAPLDEAVELAGPLPQSSVRVLGAAFCTALGQLHRSDVVHRDLKPPNIVLTSTGPRVIDFGIARPEHGLTLTTTGQIPVTPGYGAPEQVLGRRVAPPADVFSLGAVLVYAATGRRA
ncbi:protein kinase [Streptomyces sp. NPDC059262]|uniref:protein kinase domain-containing protein n=1 Tax=Streptomyces sp. NPDC059262 TaxID=3346797 RepID=UPI0036A73A05